MAIRRRIEDLSRPGYYENRNTALLMIRDFSAVWVEEGVSMRRLTTQEIYEARVAHAAKRQYVEAPLSRFELPSTRFERPKQTTYRAPWKVYEETAEPVCVSYCRWPRRETSAAA